MITTYLLLIAAAIAEIVCSIEYNGVKLGTLRNRTHNLEADVWIVNDTTLQLTNFKISEAKDKPGYSFYFSTGKKTTKAMNIYKIITTPAGEYSKPIENSLDDGLLDERVVIRIPSNYKNWEHFGIATEKNPHYLAAVQLDEKAVPRKYCCISDEEQKNQGLVGRFYNVSSAPLEVYDSRTLLLPQFSFEGSKPPDGWIFAGKGQIDKALGHKAFVIGKDIPQRHCPLTTDYLGNKDLWIYLGGQETVYDINYISVFCYEYGVDFGHIYFHLSPEHVLVPPYIPPVQNKAPSAVPVLPC